jgi:hypothetical protein
MSERLLLGRYRLRQFLGGGGMADVYLAFDEKRQALVAIKILREDMAEDPYLLRGFRREAEALAKLDHPNIVRFYGFEQDGDTAFIVMDYVDGTTLRRKLKEQGGALPLKDVTAILRDVCAALNYGHLEGFAHRDLKPANVMLKRDGSAVIADFGISRPLASATMTAAITGTPAYMSPEQFEGAQPDARSDIYSLGVMLFELATGRRPFTGEEAELTGTDTPSRLQAAHLRLPPPDPRAINRSLPSAAAEVIGRALAKDPAGRWPDAVSLRRAWEAAVGATDKGTVVVERPSRDAAVEPRAAPVAAPAGNGKRAPVIAGALALLAVAAVAVLLLTRGGGGSSSATAAVSPATVDAPAQVTRVAEVGPRSGDAGGAEAATATATRAKPSQTTRPTRRPGSGGGVAVATAAVTQRASPAATQTRLASAITATLAITDTAPRVEPTLIPTFTPNAPPTRPSATATAVRAAADAGAPRSVATPVSGFSIGGVALLVPADGEKIVGQGTFEWRDLPGFSLRANELYELVICGLDEDLLMSGRSPVGASKHNMAQVNLGDMESLLGLAQGQTYKWGVRLFVGGAAKRMLSEPRTFVYAKAGGAGGGGQPEGCNGPLCP